MHQLIIREANLPNGTQHVDIACNDGRISVVSPQIETSAETEIDASHCLVTSPFVDSHFHMDATLTYGRPRVNRSGTLLEGIALWSELKPSIDSADIKRRAHALCRWAIAKGNLAIRSHVDICDPALTAVHSLLEVKKEISPYLDLQLVAFPQDGYFRHPEATRLLDKALDLGVDVVGGIPHFERTQDAGAASVTALCEIAERRGLMADLHCDESDDPHSRHVETLCAETQRLGLEGRVTGSHLTSMHSMDNYYAGKLLSIIEETQLHVIANPLINITLQGRMDSYPKRRGMTRVKEMMERDINVAMGHDCALDPWYAQGSHDMLEVAQMGLHIAQMTGQEDVHKIFAAVTTNAAKILQLQDYGLTPGCYADLVILQASNPAEALRLRPSRLYVIRRGEIIARSQPAVSQVNLFGQTYPVAFRDSEYAPATDGVLT